MSQRGRKKHDKVARPANEIPRSYRWIKWIATRVLWQRSCNARMLMPGLTKVKINRRATLVIARIYVAAIIAIGAAVLISGAEGWRLPNLTRFLCYLALEPG